MIKSDSSKFGKPLYIMYPGDYFATHEDCVMGTVTGSTVAVCLYDKVRKIGGMGHFIVPGSLGTEGIVQDDIARQGVLSMEFLMGEIVKAGGDRRYMNAKIFGAGYLGKGTGEAINISNSNIQFIHEYFTLEKITVERNDLGGNFRRRIYFSPHDGVVYRQILKNNEESSEFIRLEREYIDIQFRNKERTGRIVIFE